MGRPLGQGSLGRVVCQRHLSTSRPLGHVRTRECEIVGDRSRHHPPENEFCQHNHFGVIVDCERFGCAPNSDGGLSLYASGRRSDAMFLAWSHRTAPAAPTIGAESCIDPCAFLGGRACKALSRPGQAVRRNPLRNI